MNIEQLMYIVEVAKSQSLAQAANSLHISQSAISQAITRLENELNLKIFNRARTGVTITKEGEKIIEKANKALLSIHEIKEEAQHQRNVSTNTLRLSTIPGLTSPIIDTYLQDQNRSLLKIELFEKSSLEIMEDVRKDLSDIGFIALNDDYIEKLNDLHFIPLFKGNMVAFASATSSLANLKIISADNLINQSLILYKDIYVKTFVSDFQRLYGPLEVLLFTTDTKIIDNAMTKLDSITLGHDISSLFYPEHLHKKGKKIDLKGTIDMTFQYGWVQKKDVHFSVEAQKFIDNINTVFTAQTKKVEHLY